MKLKFKAKGACPLQYEISGETINGIDLSVFPEGGQFVGDEQTQEAGIYGVAREDGELVVTLGQKGVAYECCVYSSDWRGDPELLIDSTDYDPGACYIVATAAPEGAEYKRTDAGWTVYLPEQEVQNELV